MFSQAQVKVSADEENVNSSEICGTQLSNWNKEEHKLILESENLNLEIKTLNETHNKMLRENVKTLDDLSKEKLRLANNFTSKLNSLKDQITNSNLTLQERDNTINDLNKKIEGLMSNHESMELLYNATKMNLNSEKQKIIEIEASTISIIKCEIDLTTLKDELTSKISALSRNLTRTMSSEKAIAAVFEAFKMQQKKLQITFIISLFTTIFIVTAIILIFETFKYCKKKRSKAIRFEMKRAENEARFQM